MIQYVQAPMHLVSDVMAFVTQRLEAPVEAWPEEEIRKLWQESARNIRRTLTLLASNAGDAVPGQTIAREALGVDDKGHAVAGMMGAFNRRMKGRHKGRSPITANYNAVAGAWEYSLSPDVARVILTLAAL